MKWLFFIFGLFFVLISCKKSSKEEVSELYPVVFRINHLYSDLPEPKAVTVFSSADSLLNKYGVLHYFVFDAEGKFIHRLKQVKGDSSFGEISDKLKIGQYTFVMVSCTNELNVGANLTSLAATKVKSLANSGDIFYKKLTLNVTAAGISRDVVLDRIVGCVEIRITDRVADNISRIELQIDNETPYFNLNTDLVDPTYSEVRSVSDEVNDSNRSAFSLGLLLLNDQVPISATIKLFDANSVLIKSKKFTGIQNIRRKKVSVTGKMSDFMSVGFKIGYDEAWLSDSTVINF